MPKSLSYQDSLNLCPRIHKTQNQFKGHLSCRSILNSVSAFLNSVLSNFSNYVRQLFSHGIRGDKSSKHRVHLYHSLSQVPHVILSCVNSVWAACGVMWILEFHSLFCLCHTWHWKSYDAHVPVIRQKPCDLTDSVHCQTIFQLATWKCGQK